MTTLLALLLFIGVSTQVEGEENADAQSQTNFWHAPNVLGLSVGTERATLAAVCRTRGFTLQPEQMFDAKSGGMVPNLDTMSIGTGRPGIRVYALLRNGRLWLIEVNQEFASIDDAFAFELLVFGQTHISLNGTADGLRQYKGDGWAGEFTWSSVPPVQCRAAVWQTDTPVVAGSHTGETSEETLDVDANAQ